MMGSPQPNTQIYNAVHAQAIAQGIPDALWEDVAFAESGYNPKALGDNGTSFGLFQLHIGGQLPAQYESNPTALYDPSLNAQYGLPAIARSWNALKGSFNPNSLTWWENFGSQSGHPGGTPGEKANYNEALNLQKYYNASSGGTTGIQLSNPLQFCGPNDCDCIYGAGTTQANQCKAQGPNSIGVDTTGLQNAILGPLEKYFQPALIRIGLFIVGIILIIAGVVVLRKQTI